MITENYLDTLLVDREFVRIPDKSEAQPLNERSVSQWNTFPFAPLSRGKFRKLFDRHLRAYCH